MSFCQDFHCDILLSHTAASHCGSCCDFSAILQKISAQPHTLCMQLFHTINICKQQPRKEQVSQKFVCIINVWGCAEWISTSAPGLSLRAGSRGFLPAIMNTTLGYFHSKIEPKKLLKIFYCH